MRTVLEVDALFDGTRTMDGVAVVIADGEVAWVGKRSRTPKTPRGERSVIVKAPAPFAMPGMVNCHAHLSFDGSANFDAEAHQTDALATIKAFRNGRASLRAGITTVRDLGANGTMVLELARAIEARIVEGPRILAAVRGITTTGGHGGEVGRIADGADAVRRAAREQIAAGCGVIKFFSTGGVLGEGAGPHLAQFTLEETRPAVEEAHKAGLKITTHAHGSEGMRIAAEAGVDSIEHCTLLDKQTIALVKERDVALVPTFAAIRCILDNADKLPARVRERARSVAAQHQEGMRAAYKAGIRIAAGTDAGTPFNRHEAFARELGYLTEIGMKPSEALAAATSRAAEVIGLPKAGRIAVGMWADLLFVEGDPTRDVAVTLAPVAVWIRGAPLAA